MALQPDIFGRIGKELLRKVVEIKQHEISERGVGVGNDATGAVRDKRAAIELRNEIVTPLCPDVLKSLGKPGHQALIPAQRS